MEKNTLFEQIISDCMKSPYNYGFDKLDENSINRILKHGEDEGFIVISASKMANEPQDNKQCEKELKKDIQEAGYSYTPVYGGYKEDSEKPVFEPSFIVYNKDRSGKTLELNDLIRFGMDMAKKYEQECFYLKRPGVPPCFVNCNGKKISEKESDSVKINRPDETFFTTDKRDKSSSHTFTSDINFPEENSKYEPEYIFEGKYYAKRVNYQDKILRTQLGEIFI